MSITVTTDVFCDNEDCSAWEFGYVGNVMNVNAARRRAKSCGWTRKNVMGDLMDLCPECTKKLTAYYNQSEETSK
jgi:hypothetical protein